MNGVNRFLNRMLLFLAGGAVLVAGLGVLASGTLAAGTAPTWLHRAASTATDVAERIAGWTWRIDGFGAVSAPLSIGAAVAVVLAALLLLFLATRRRGRTATVLELDGARGRTTVDRDVAEAILTAPLLRRPDVLAARTSVYRVGGARAVELAVIVRPGARLGSVVAAAEDAVREWDQMLGERLPVMVHLADRRWRDAFRTRIRVR